MDNKYIEEKLKESMHAIEPENFSDRMNRICDRLDESGDVREVATEEIAVTVSSQGATSRRNINIKAIAIAIAATLIFSVCLGVLIWRLLPDKSNGYTTSFGDLGYEPVEEGEFYDKVSGSKIPLIDMNNFYDDIYSYSLLFDKEYSVLGGMVSAENETAGYVLTVEFCMVNVQGFKEVEGQVQTYILECGQELQYTTIAEGDEYVGYIYTTTANVIYKNLNYYIAYTSLEDSALAFIDDMFK